MLYLSQNLWLFIVCVLIWGSTWIAITFQLGVVEPVLSVAYRYSIAALVLLLYCRYKKLCLKLPPKTHLLMACVGLSLYTLDYTLLYESEKYIVSAVVALLSSCIIYFNVLLRWLLLGKAVRVEVIIGATLGLLGMLLMFLPEFVDVAANDLLLYGVGLAFASFFFAAIGNVLSEKILDKGTPVVQMNFWAMSYGLVFMYSYALLSGVEFLLPTNWEYLGSLFYLAIFGSVLAFGAYMKLVQQIGSDKSAYVVLIYPIVALILSTLFEGYRWQWYGFLGIAIILFGNAIAMGKIPLFFINKKHAVKVG